MQSGAYRGLCLGHVLFVLGIWPTISWHALLLLLLLCFVLRQVLYCTTLLSSRCHMSHILPRAPVYAVMIKFCLLLAE